jgi:hypothetical protein
MNSSSQPAAPPPTYRAGTQVRKIVGLTVFAVACAAGAAWWGLDLGQSWGLAEADGGVLKPLWQRMVLGSVLTILGLSFPAGMFTYWSRYIVRLDLEDGGRTLRIGRLAPFPSLRLPVEQVKIGDQVQTGHGGEFSLASARMSSVQAPWLWVEIRGWRWPLVLDLRGTFGERGGSAPKDRSPLRAGRVR